MKAYLVIAVEAMRTFTYIKEMQSQTKYIVTDYQGYLDTYKDVSTRGISDIT